MFKYVFQLMNWVYSDKEFRGRIENEPIISIYIFSSGIKVVFNVIRD
ncbi:hypothetical protein ACFYKX_03890 [Cytobacillus sp. FJAT-54145]|uniref:Uncharacterized protein n=1 Tax=Cytobacillus spartinae TaxID=3299023 RepID=A0ABW6K6E6_9BACI